MNIQLIMEIGIEGFNTIYDELIFIDNDGTRIIYHLGLEEWFSINGTRFDFLYGITNPKKLFEISTGLTPNQFRRVYNRLNKEIIIGIA